MGICVVAGRLNRVMCLSLAVTAFLFSWLDPLTARAGEATEAMRGTIDEVLRVLADKDLKQPSKANERRQMLEKVVGERFDYREMSRRALGAPWNNLAEKDKAEFVSLFETLLVNTYADKIESYYTLSLHDALLILDRKSVV